MTYQKLLKKILILIFSLAFIFTSCKGEKKENPTEALVVADIQKEPFFKLSLAQWSLHKFVNDENGSPFLFAEQAKEMGFEGLEYVNQLFDDEIKELGFNTVIDSLKTLSEKHNMNNVLIMIDNEGDLADPDEDKRNQAVENHKKWVDAAKKLGCHSIRVNTFGTNDPELWKIAVVDGLKKLSIYAATKNINVLCENHGWLSSDTPKLMDAINTVNMDNCGTLPDTGNFCTKRIEGAQWGECAEHSEPYEGIKLMMSKAKGVSAKNVDFPDAGIILDYVKIIKIVKDSGFNGYIGVEFSGAGDEKTGILTIKDLLLKSAENLK